MKLKQRVLMLGAAGLAAACALGFVGWFGQKLLLESSTRQAGAATAVRAQMQVDMMHDALHSDVLSALLAATKQADAAHFSEIRNDLGEHIGIIRKALAELRSSSLDADLQTQLETVGPQVEAYAAEAIAIVDLAANDARSANARLPRFQEAFGVLEVTLSGVGDRIEALIAGQVVAGEAVARKVTLAQIGSLAALAALLAWLSLAVTRRIMGQLGADPAEACSVADRIASGALDHEVEGAATHPGSVMASLSRMQQELRDRAAIAAENSGRLEAISRVQAVIEFGLDATILSANANFEKTMGYVQADIVGKPHRVLCDAADVAHPDYVAMWERLRRGEFVSGRVRRIARDGRVVWLDASYNPLLDSSGRPVKVVKYARDITGEMTAEAEITRISEAAANGDFMHRVSVDDKAGFLLALGRSINLLMETSSTGLGEVVRVLGALARGDLTETISADYRGTFGQLKCDSNQTVAQLSKIVSTIQQATGTIHIASREIAAGNQDLSSRTEQQAASLEETASSMEELTSTVRQNSENALRAKQLALEASDIAGKGGTVVSNVVSTMSEISVSSKKVVDIISVIDGIAFQTNILALNAAVEAARAVEQGRGFAVVASEVRSLAQRSASAAKEIKVLIGDSVEKVGNGTKLVEQAGRTMEAVVESVKQVAEIVSAISAASEQQSSGIEQVNQAITQMDEVTQQNAALVEQAAASARSLEEQAETLAHTVSVFVLDPSHSTAQVEMARTPGSVLALGQSSAVSRKKPSPRKPATSTNPNSLPLRKASGSEVWNEF